MDIKIILTQLRAKRIQIDEALRSLERLASGRVLGRPPNGLDDTAPRRRGRPRGSKNKVPLTPRRASADSSP